jgi:enamine deaminase RidA (YjgF/YER057c/UK114 family)
VKDSPMKNTIAARMAELGIELGPAPAPAGGYTATTIAGDLLFVSGQVAVHPQQGPVSSGLLGGRVDLATGIACARQCALNVLTQAAAALGSLDRIVRVVKLTVFIASTPDFTAQPTVANGASELIKEVFGDAGSHTRSAVGVAALPGGSPVEVEAILQIEGSVQ